VTGGTTPGNHCQETFAWGLRNPFRFARDSNAADVRFFINDVGQDAWEEIDDGQAGVDYGWNCREGRHTNNTSGPCNPTPAGMIDPIFEYQHGAVIPGTTSPTSCGAITGGAFVPNGLWPVPDGTYLAADFNCGVIFRMTNPAGTWIAADFASNLGASSATSLNSGTSLETKILMIASHAVGKTPDLARVARIFDVVEINSPFYRLPRAGMAEKWLLAVKGRWVFRRSVRVFGNFKVIEPQRVTIGANCAINHGVFILGRVGVHIGDDVVLSARCMLLDAGLDTQDTRGVESRSHVAKPIRIEDGAWIGAGAIILPGVTIGHRSVVGAGSVVTKDVPAGTVVAGNPAKPIGNRATGD
jgi:acetyltransferase-like isoleucine patch superfamily enzyme